MNVKVPLQSVNNGTNNFVIVLMVMSNVRHPASIILEWCNGRPTSRMTIASGGSYAKSFNLDSASSAELTCNCTEWNFFFSVASNLRHLLAKSYKVEKVTTAYNSSNELVHHQLTIISIIFTITVIIFIIWSSFLIQWLKQLTFCFVSSNLLSYTSSALSSLFQC